MLSSWKKIYLFNDTYLCRVNLFFKNLFFKTKMFTLTLSKGSSKLDELFSPSFVLKSSRNAGFGRRDDFGDS